MEPRKRPATSESKKGEKKLGGSKKDNEGSLGRKKEEKVKSSLIPKPKVAKNDVKSSVQSRRPSRQHSVQVNNDDVKLKSLEEKEKCLGEYFSKIEELIQSIAEKKEKENVSADHYKCASPTKSCPLSSARKMISDPQVFKKGKTVGNVLSDFESNVQEISEIWLKTSADLTNTLKILKSNPSMDPIQLEVESVRIQLAIKQAKSLTIVKTRNVIAEAKKLMNHREMIRSELENYLSSENLKTGRKSHKERESKTGGTGDSTKDGGSSAKEEAGVGSSENKCEDSVASSQMTGGSSQTTSADEVKTWAGELARKNEIIAQLHNKIFELQKACSEHSLKYNQLQMKLAEFHEKIQWDQVLWKQIGKLKELIKGLQQSNKQLESQKRELEGKITKLDEELQRLVKLNHVLNQQKYLMNAQEKCVADEELPKDCAGEECRGDETRETHRNYDTPEKILAEKQNLINQLNTILNLMRDQENVAQKQIAAFQSKIEELEKNSRT